jgi:hypothetical protein
MLFRNLRYHLAEKKINRLLKEKNIKISPQSWNHINTIGVIGVVDSAEQFQSYIQMFEELQSDGKQVKMLIYSTLKKNDFNSNNSSISICTKDDFTFIFIPKSEIIEQFISNSFDMLLDLNLYVEFPMRSVSLLSNASFKVGIDDMKNKHFQLSFIWKNADLTAFYNQITDSIKHLKIM